MSTFNTYSITDNKLLSFVVKYSKLFYYLYWTFYLLSLFSINKIFTDIIGNIYISIASFLIFAALVFFINKRQKQILKAIESDGKLKFYKTKITFNSQNKTETFEKESLKNIKIIKKLSKTTDYQKYKFNLVHFETTNKETREILIETNSNDKKPFELVETLDFFARINKISFEKK